MSIISAYPNFTDLKSIEGESVLELKNSIDSVCNAQIDGVSEFTFANIFLHKYKYAYKVSAFNNILIVLGESSRGGFFITIGGIPTKEVVFELFRQKRFWKLISPSLFELYAVPIENWGIRITEDRNNYDYLYLRTDLAELKGKSFHKKKNLVNAFKSAHTGTIKPIDNSTMQDALLVLENWNKNREGITDYEPAKTALLNNEKLGLKGWVMYADGIPSGWALGEYMAGGTMFCVHFEKGNEQIKGIYQYVNQMTALQLEDSVMYINREQDLGDEGLRQAKMTYRPCGFVKKYRAAL